MKELKCRKGLTFRVMSAGMCGYSIGTVVEKGEDRGIPNCRCSGYYKTDKLAQQALESRTFDRICAENMFCNGGQGCLGRGEQK